MSSTTRDLGRERGLSPETLRLFNVRANGTGWLYDFKCSDGSAATRRKSFYSLREQAPQDERETWAKYTWQPHKPDTAKYFYPVGMSLTRAIEEAWGTLWLVGGDIAGMTMIDAGLLNATSCFGDKVPDTLLDDLTNWKVSTLRLVPDRDSSGQRWAVDIRDRIASSLAEIDLIVHALPYPLEEKHGRDVNDFWRDSSRDKAAFRQQLIDLPRWSLPQPQAKPLPNLMGQDNGAIPAELKAELRFRLGLQTDRFNSDGWAQKNVCCPFHDDETPSATWNDESGTLYCHTCGRSYLAKELCGMYGLRMSDYFERASVLQLATHAPVVYLTETPRETPVTLQMRPPLPASAALTPAQEVEARRGRAWLDAYVGWAKQAGPLSPDIFYEAMGLWTLALASTRRMQVVIGGEHIFPNLYIFIVANTTVYRKSTALNLVNQIIEKANLDFLKMPQRATPEALFEYLAGRVPANLDSLSETDVRHWEMGRTFAAQRGIVVDEASGLLSEMKKDYNSGLAEILLQGYDGQGTSSRLLKSQGLIIVRDMCLSFLGATTPVEWARRMTIEEQQNGFVARFAIITPEQAPTYLDAPDEVPLPQPVISRLRHLFIKVLPWDKSLLGSDGLPRPLSRQAQVTPPPVLNVSLDPAALDQIKRYRKALGFDMLAATDSTIDDDKAGSYARLGTMMIKVAMLLAAIDTDAPPIRIEPRHAYAAQMICERWRESLHRLDQHVAQSKRTKTDDKVLAFVKAAGALGVTARDVQRGCALENSAKTMEQLRTLIDAGMVEQFKRETKGRPAVCYRVPTGEAS